MKRVPGDTTLNTNTVRSKKAMFRKLMLLNRLNAKKDPDLEDNIPLQKIDEDRTEVSANAEDDCQETDYQEDNCQEDNDQEVFDENISIEASEPVKDEEPEVEGVSQEISTDQIEEVVHEEAQDGSANVQDQGQMNQEEESVKNDVVLENKINDIPEKGKEEIKAPEVKLNESNPKENEQRDKEEVAESKGLWFNPELRKQIHVTAKGWELRGPA